MNSTKKKYDPILESLQRAVNNALDKKRKLGQYYVIAKNGKPMRIDPDHPAYWNLDKIKER